MQYVLSYLSRARIASSAAVVGRRAGALTHLEWTQVELACEQEDSDGQFASSRAVPMHRATERKQTFAIRLSGCGLSSEGTPGKMKRLSGGS